MVNRVLSLTSTIIKRVDHDKAGCMTEPLAHTPLPRDGAQPMYRLPLLSQQLPQHFELLRPMLRASGSSQRRESPSGSDEPQSPLSASDSAAEDENGKRRAKYKTRKRPRGVSANSTEEGSAKTRQPTYLVQKHEREALLEEIRVLDARRELLKIKSGLPTDNDKRSVATLKARNVEYEEKIHTNLQSFGRLQSMLAREIHEAPINTTTSYIHLPREVRERQSILRALKDIKLRRAQDLAASHFHNVARAKPYLYEERCLTEDGVYHCKRFELDQFEGFRSSRQLYDALLYFFSHVEITVTETLGNLTIREDSGDIDPTIWNHRLISRSTAGFTEELNIVGFTEFYESDAATGGAPLGVVASDWVDQDNLHPYVSSERVRRDVTSSHTISEFRKPDTQELVVVHASCVYLTIHPPQFPRTAR